jgi:uncharacterized membrane protein
MPTDQAHRPSATRTICLIVAFRLGDATEGLAGESILFLFRGLEMHRRSFAKAVSWRTLGSIDTFILGLIFTSSVKLAGSIAITEVFTKIVLYYLHERAWAYWGWGHRGNPPPQPGGS